MDKLSKLKELQQQLSNNSIAFERAIDSAFVTAVKDAIAASDFLPAAYQSTYLGRINYLTSLHERVSRVLSGADHELGAWRMYDRIESEVQKAIDEVSS